MASYALELEKFEFPNDLDPDNANFRVVVDFQCVDEKDQPRTASRILPGADSYWECDPEEKKDRKYRGLASVTDKGHADYGKTSIPEFERYLFPLNISKPFSIKVTIFDVDREDWHEKLFDKLSLFVPGASKDLLPAYAAGGVGDVLKALFKKLGIKDRLLFSKGCNVKGYLIKSRKYLYINGLSGYFTDPV